MTDDADADLCAAIAWYSAQRKGLGRQFNRAVRATLTQLSKVAEAHAKIYGDVRQARVAGFPYYVVHYLIDPAQVTVFSVFHTSRNPRTWQSRADDLEQS